MLKAGGHVDDEPHYPRPKSRKRPELSAEYRSEVARYESLHRLCPACGSDRMERTCVGMVYGVDAKAEEMCDDNRAMCVCGWRGIVHDCGPSNGSDVE